MVFNPFSAESSAASFGASVGAQLGARAGPVGAGIGAGFGAAGGYIAGALATPCPARQALTDGGQPADEQPPERTTDEGERHDPASSSPPARVEIPVTEG